MHTSVVDSYFINASISSRQLLHQCIHQQQIATSSMHTSAVDSYFINAYQHQIYFSMDTSAVDSHFVYAYISSKQLATSSMQTSAVDSYCIYAYIRSRQLLHLCIHQQQITTSSMHTSAVDSYFINAYISGRLRQREDRGMCFPLKFSARGTSPTKILMKKNRREKMQKRKEKSIKVANFFTGK